MNTLNRKNISIALFITLSAIFTMNANAAQTSNIENSLTEMVIVQSQQVMSDISTQLEQSITAELNSFSIDFSFEQTIEESLAWLTNEQLETIIVDVTKN